MNVRCPTCQVLFRVDPARIPASGVRARCSRCGNAFTIAAPAAAAAPVVEPAAAREPEPPAPRPVAADPQPVFSPADPVVPPTDAFHAAPEEPARNELAAGGANLAAQILGEMNQNARVLRNPLAVDLPLPGLTSKLLVLTL